MNKERGGVNDLNNFSTLKFSRMFLSIQALKVTLWMVKNSQVYPGYVPVCSQDYFLDSLAWG